MDRTGIRIVAPFEIGTILEDYPAAFWDTVRDYACSDDLDGYHKRAPNHSADLVLCPKTE